MEKRATGQRQDSGLRVLRVLSLSSTYRLCGRGTHFASSTFTFFVGLSLRREIRHRILLRKLSETISMGTGHRHERSQLVVGGKFSWTPLTLLTQRTEAGLLCNELLWARSRDPHFPPRLSKDLILLFLDHSLWGLGGHHGAVADTGWIIFSISVSSTDPGFLSPPLVLVPVALSRGPWHDPLAFLQTEQSIWSLKGPYTVSRRSQTVPLHHRQAVWSGPGHFYLRGPLWTPHFLLSLSIQC